MTTLRGPDIWIELDEKEIFPDDPGQGTPVLVCCKNGGTATWNCAMNELELDNGSTFTQAQIDWLNRMESQVNEWCDAHGV